jgi:hypothetical protein
MGIPSRRGARQLVSTDITVNRCCKYRFYHLKPGEDKVAVRESLKSLDAIERSYQCKSSL